MTLDLIRCPSCSGSGLHTDGGAFERQTCTTDDDCRRCDGTGLIPRTTVNIGESTLYRRSHRDD